MNSSMSMSQQQPLGSSPSYKSGERQQFFPASYGGLRLQVIRGEDFVHPRALHSVREPVVRVHIGNFSHPSAKGRPVTEKKGAFVFNTAMELPYKGELRLRFLVYDTYKNAREEIGFHDMNLTTMNFEQPQFGIINLAGRKGFAGKLQISVEPTPDCIPTPVYRSIGENEVAESPMNARAESMGASPASTTIASTDRRASEFSDASSALEELAESQRVGSANLVRCIVTDAAFDPTRMTALAGGNGKTFAEDYFIKAQYSEHTMRSDMTVAGGLRPVFHEEFLFPFDGHRAIAFAVYINRKMKRDIKLGTGACILTSTFALPEVYHPFQVQIRDKQGILMGYLNVKCSSNTLPNKPLKAEIRDLNDNGMMTSRSTSGNVSRMRSGSLDSDISDMGGNEMKASIAAAMAGEQVRALNAHSLRLTLLRGEELRNPYVSKKSMTKSGKMEVLNPYALCWLGKESLRCHTCYKGHMSPAFSDTFYFPYRGERFLGMDMYNDKQYARDKRLGKTVIDLNGHAMRGPQLVALPLIFTDSKTKQTGSAGKVHAILEFCDAMEPMPRVMRTLPHQATIVTPQPVLPLIVPVAPREVEVDVTAEANAARLAELKRMEEEAALEERRRQEELARLEEERRRQEELMAAEQERLRIEEAAAAAAAASAAVIVTEEVANRSRTSSTASVEVVVAPPARVSITSSSSSSKKVMEAAVAVNTTEMAATARSLSITSSSSKPGNGKVELNSSISGVEVIGGTVAPAMVVVPAVAAATSPIYAGDVLKERELVASREGYQYIQGPPKTIRIRLIRAENLRPKKAERAVECDPYVIAKLGHDKRQSEQCHNTISPVFKQTMIWEYEKRHQEVEFKFKDERNRAKDETLAEGKLDLTPYINKGCNRDYEAIVPLTGKKGPAGQLLISIEPSMSPFDKHHKIMLSSAVPISIGVTAAANKQAEVNAIRAMNGASSSSISSDHIELQRAKDIKCIRIRLLEAEGILPTKKPTKERGLYVEGKMGHGKRRSKEVIHTAHPTFVSSFQWSYKQERNCRIRLYDNLDNHKDTLLGEGLVKIGPSIMSPGVPVEQLVPLFDDADDKKREPRGVCKVTVEAMHSEFDGREVLEHAADGTIILLPAVVAAAAASRSMSASSPKAVSPKSPSVAELEATRMRETLVNPSPCLGLRIAIMRGQDLKNPHTINAIDTLDPYAVVTCGSATQKTPVVKDGGKNAKFYQQVCLPYANSRHLRIDLMDSAHMSSDPLIGSGYVDLNDYVYKGEMGHEIKLPLLSKKKNKPCGLLNIRIEVLHKAEKMRCRQLTEDASIFVPPVAAAVAVSTTPVAAAVAVSTTPVAAAVVERAISSPAARADIAFIERAACKSVRVAILKGTNLKNPHKIKGFDKIDTYVVGFLSKDKLRTAVVDDGGSNCAFKEGFEFPYNGINEVVRLEVLDNAHGMSDLLVGKTEIMLPKIFESGRNGDIINLPLLTEKGKAAGILTVRVEMQSGPVPAAQVFRH